MPSKSAAAESSPAVFACFINSEYIAITEFLSFIADSRFAASSHGVWGKIKLLSKMPDAIHVGGGLEQSSRVRIPIHPCTCGKPRVLGVSERLNRHSSFKISFRLWTHCAAP